MMKPLVLLDAKGTLMHSLFRGKDPEPVLDSNGKKLNSAAHAIQTWLNGYIEDALKFTTPMNIIAVWDGGMEFRRRVFTGYKKSRDTKVKEPVQEEQLKLAYDSAKRIIAYSGGINMVVDTVEADDVIACIARQCTDRPVIIFTRDADLLALASDNVTVRQCDEWVEDFNGLPFKHVTLFKALCGDSSDEYGGVPQIGAKKAFPHLVTKYGLDGLDELEAMIKHNRKEELSGILKDDPDKVLQKIYDNWPVARTCYQLATLHPNLCWGFVGKKQIKPQFYTRLPDADKLRKVLEKVRCGHLYEQYFGPYTPEFRLVTESNLEVSVDFMRQKLTDTDFVAFDHETWDAVKHADFVKALPATRRKDGYVDTLSQQLTGTSFCFGDNNQYTFYFSFDHKDTENVPKHWSSQMAQVVLEEGLTLVAHNANFEEQVTKQECDVILSPIIDTRIMACYVNEDRFHGLKDLSFEEFAYTQTEYSQLLAMYGAETMQDLTGEEVLAYGCDDSFVTAHLYKLYWLILTMEGSRKFYEDNDVLTTHVLNRSFEHGVAIDYDELKVQHARDLKTIQEGMASLRADLSKHCTEPKPAAATALWQMEKEYLAIKLTGTKEKLNPRQIHARLEEKRLLWVEKSVYVPYQRTEEMPDFLPTALQLTAIADAIGLAVPVASISTSGIAKWVAEADSLLINGGKGKAAKLQNEFVTLMAAAAHQTKKREGDCYDKLLAFCIKHNPASPRVREIGDELNLNSPNQMTELLYCKLGLPVRTHTMPQKESVRKLHGLEGSPSTDEEAMEMAIAEDCPEGDWRREFLRTLISIKAAETRCSLYWNPYPFWKHPRDGAIHGGIKNCGTLTRRPSGSSPNFLQVAKNETRRIFVPRFKKSLIVSLDFNGQELRLTGSESRDPVLIECYTGGGTYTDEDGMLRTVTRDVHSVTGSGFARAILSRKLDKGLLNSLPFDSDGVLDYDFFRGVAKGDEKFLKDFAEVRDILKKGISDVRGMAKVVNFLLIYGGTAFTLAGKLGVPEKFAEELMALVFSRYPRLQPWQEETIAFAAKRGYVQTAYNTRRHLTEDIVSNVRSIRNRMGRQAVNYTIQATAAEILKIVLTGMHTTNLMEDVRGQFYCPVYDEITSSIPIDNIFEYVSRLQDLMNITPPGHKIAMLSEVSIGPNWADLTEIGDRPSERKIIAAVEKIVKEAA